MPLPQHTNVEPRAFHCPRCGAPVTVHNPHQSQSVACGSCGSVLDVRTPEVKLLQEYAHKVTYQPIIPLGKKGKLRGEDLMCIGLLRRQVHVEGMPYTWSEYLLWNPFLGYRWLSESEGHWSLLRFTNNVAQSPRIYDQRVVNFHGQNFRHFQTATAETTFVLGEFNWIVQRGDKANCYDFVCPPMILSGEETTEEYTWCIGDYVWPAAIWDGFALAGEPKAQVGVGACQPDPYVGNPARMWTIFGSFSAVALVITLFFPLFVHEGSAPWCCFLPIVGLLLAWPIARSSMASTFEQRRWSESDHA